MNSKVHIAQVTLRGFVLLEHFRNGILIAKRETKNIITNAGLAVISGLLITDVSVNDFDEIAIGTGAVSGTADSGNVGGTTTVDTERTEAEDYWNGATITYVTGSNAGAIRDITDFVAATATITHDAFTNQVVAGDQYKLSARPTSTALLTEIAAGGGERRTAGNVTGSRQQTTVPNDTAQLVTTFTFTGAYGIDECGVFNDPAAGDMLCATAFGDVNVVSGDTIQITWRIVSSFGGAS